MRKNKMMRLASALLVAVLLTTCAISGTFAKYVTEGSANDSARVAKWGVTITGVTGDANQMFAKEYGDNDADYNGVSVSSTVNVIAPGTDGTFSSFTVEGTPEVATRVTYTPVVELGNNWIDKDDATKFYCPIKVTVTTNVGTQTLCGLDYASADAFEDAIEALITAGKMDYAPGSVATVNDDLTISWAWDFTGATGSENNQSDAKDTFLGTRAVVEANAATISVAVTVTITQID